LIILSLLEAVEVVTLVALVVVQVDFVLPSLQQVVVAPLNLHYLYLLIRPTQLQ
jgi:hypothetical protein